MLDETLPPDGDNEVAYEPAPQSTGPVVPEAADVANEPAAPAAAQAGSVTAEPTADPSAEPSAKPSAKPSAEPSAGPSAEPSPEPGAESLTEPDAAMTAGPATDEARPDADDKADVGPPTNTAAAEAPAPSPEMTPAACAALLAERFPGLFAAGRALPIKLRVQVDIQARAPGVFTRKAMSLFLHRYTTSTAYLKALVASPHRFDLDGAPAGEIAAEHREAAQAELQRRQAIVQEKRSAQRRLERQPKPGQGPRGAGHAPANPQAVAPAGAPGEGAAATALPAHGGQASSDPGPATRPPPPQQQRPRRDVQRPPRPDAQRPPRPDGQTTGQPSSQGRGDQAARGPRPATPRRYGLPDAAHGPAAAGVGAGGNTHANSKAASERQTRPPSSTPAGLPLAEIEARRERAALLRAYESSTLTKANFCVLKRVSEADLDSALAQARQERGEPIPRPGR
ncbi:MAG TPA: ProQ/FINO family protein [Rubrivivax sp.]|nr:ProQ/FINO family protein [Rubrivivax sp.]